MQFTLSDETPVQSLEVSMPGSPILYSRVRCLAPLRSRHARLPAKLRLVQRLLRWSTGQAGGCQLPGPRAYQERSEPVFCEDRWGRPRLILGDKEGPSISFSFLGDQAWGALCSRPHRVGVDAAHPAEFPEDYPFARAFPGRELEAYLDRHASNRAEAAATIWSVKEAVVKALGCGFRLLDPLDLEVRPANGPETCKRFLVHLSDRVTERCPAMGADSIVAATVDAGPRRLSFSTVDALRAVALCNSRTGILPVRRVAGDDSPFREGEAH